MVDNLKRLAFKRYFSEQQGLTIKNVNGLAVTKSFLCPMSPCPYLWIFISISKISVHSIHEKPPKKYLRPVGCLPEVYPTEGGLCGSLLGTQRRGARFSGGFQR